MRFIPIALFVLALLSSPALAASSQWYNGEGASLRLVTTGSADSAKTLKGALQIDLKQGWKTYWKDPGDTGIPPRINVADGTVRSATFSFPAPKRIDEGAGALAGYEKPVSLPVTFKLSGPVTTLTANVFLGVCREICIPVQTSLTLDPNDGANDAGDRSLVEASLAALPGEADDAFGVSAARIDGEALIVETHIPADVEDPDLFIASGAGYLVGAPKRDAVKGGTASFSAELFERPEKWDGSAISLDYTLVAGDRAVSGKLAMTDGAETD